MTTLEHMPCDEDRKLASDTLVTATEFHFPAEEISSRIEAGVQVVHMLCEIETAGDDPSKDDGKGYTRNLGGQPPQPIAEDYKEAESWLSLDDWDNDPWAHGSAVRALSDVLAALRRNALGLE